MKKEKNNGVMSIIPKIARKVGEKSVSDTCFWLAHQPKVPSSMKKDI